MGAQSDFDPPFEGEEKYSTLGEAVSGASLKRFSAKSGYDAATQRIRRNGTSTATPIAAGIAALLIDYSWQFMDGGGAHNYESMRKLFIAMSKSTIGKDYRYLVPWSFFGAGKDPKREIKNILSTPLGIDKLQCMC
jgi:hypothetical protein